MDNPRKKAAAKAIVGRVLSPDLAQNAHSIIRRYQPLPLQMFPLLYEKHYRIIFDATLMGFDGILEFFHDLNYLIKMEKTERGNIILRLKQCEDSNFDNDCYSDIISNTSTRERLKAMTSPTNQFVAQMNYNRAVGRLFRKNVELLWPGSLKKLLEIDRKDIEIVKSPYERINIHEPIKARSVIRKLRHVLSSFPDGIEISDLSTKIAINKNLFNVTSINEFTVEYPEIFYIEEQDLGCESLVLDGRTNTYKNLKEYNFIKKDKENINTLPISKWAVESSVYQKTLIILRAAESSGLKLSVWEKTFRTNFGPDFSREEEKLLNMGGLKIFSALFRDGLLEIRSTNECKNDLRIHLPTKPIRLDFLM